MLRLGFKVRLLMLPSTTQKIKTKVLEPLDLLSKNLAGKDKGRKGLKESDSNIRISCLWRHFEALSFKE